MVIVPGRVATLTWLSYGVGLMLLERPLRGKRRLCLFEGHRAVMVALFAPPKWDSNGCEPDYRWGNN